jgi:capsular polysaccharide transport system permease protein
MATWLKKNIVLLLTVITPTFAAVLYYAFIASDVYISESRFLVRSPQHPTQGGFVGQLLQGSGITHSQDDAYSVHDYILSRDALRELDAKAEVRKAFNSKQVDPINRFPGLFRDDSFEKLYRYYGKHVGVEYDTASSITTLTVAAFTAQDAQRINDQLLRVSERLVNTLNERSRQDLIRYAADEVKIANDKATAAAVAMFEYRSKHAVFEPVNRPRFSWRVSPKYKKN